jgi:hypothetical protein
MDFSYSPRTQELQARLNAFMAEHVYPVEGRWWAEIEANTAAGRRWSRCRSSRTQAQGASRRPVEPLPA